MPDYNGLYYPHIAFPSDAWVKLAVLYWDKLGRIVPANYQHRDSDTVQRLKGELGFIEDFEPPEHLTDAVSKIFFEILDVYEEELSKCYGLPVQPFNDSELFYIQYTGKMSPALRKRFERLGEVLRRNPSLRNNFSYSHKLYISTSIYDRMSSGWEVATVRSSHSIAFGLRHGSFSRLARCERDEKAGCAYTHEIGCGDAAC